MKDYKVEKAEAYKKLYQDVEKRERKKWPIGCKIAAIIAAILLGVLLIRPIALGGVVGLLILDSVTTKVEEDTDVRNYLHYMGENADQNYRSKLSMDESIFPTRITDDMQVKDYKMVYYNPWDEQYLSYLVVDYGETEYQAEVKRLTDKGIEKYEGYYGATGFDKKYTLLAMNSDSSMGFIYALTDGKSEIVYVEIIFCNYFMDLDYDKYIEKSYLPIGFDATSDNPYQEKIMGK